MDFVVIWSDPAKKDLSELQRETVIQILKKVRLAEENPHRFIHKLAGESVWRLRAGDYRVFCEINTEQKRIEIVKIRHRKNAYK